MRNYFASNRVASFLAIILSVFFVVATVQAATTISTNIETGGTLTVSGLTTLGNASTTQISSSGTSYFAVSSGTVGIGTTTQTETLHVVDNDGAAILHLESTSSNANLIIETADGNSFSWQFTNAGAMLRLQYSGSTKSAFNSTGYLSLGENLSAVNPLHVGGGASIGAGNVAAPTNGLLVGGNVGVGTTTPATRLHVSSGASATTAVSIGELGLTTSRACVNMNQADGSPGGF